MSVDRRWQEGGQRRSSNSQHHMIIWAHYAVGHCVTMHGGPSPWVSGDTTRLFQDSVGGPPRMHGVTA